MDFTRMKRMKKVLAIIMMLALVVGQLPAIALGADVTVISTADELAALSGQTLNGHYQLAADIDMEGKSFESMTLIGTFEGNGYEIRNLTISGGGNAGLFAAAQSSSTITGVTLRDCNIQGGTTNANAGVAALVGTLRNHRNVTISDCAVIGGTVTAVGTWQAAGGLVGYMEYSGAAKISDCYSTATVSGLAHAGGLIGRIRVSSPTITNCYATGTVICNGDSNHRASGLIGHLDCDGDLYEATISNCYAAPTLQKTTDGNLYGFAQITADSNGTYENCFYLTGEEQVEVTALDGISATDSEGLKSDATLTALGSGYIADVNGVNGGYPILSRQASDTVHSLTLTVEPANAAFSLTDNDENEVTPQSSAGGVYVYTELPSGSTYTYSAEKNAADPVDYLPQSGTISIGSSDINRTITLQERRYDLTFELTPSTAKVTVRDSGGNLVSPTEGTTYSVLVGDYTYSVTAFAYEPVTDVSVRVGQTARTETVALAQRDTQTVTFGYEPSELSVEDCTLTVTTEYEGDTITIQPTTVGGLSYELPVGYEYTYALTSATYANQEGTLDLTAAAAGTQSVTLQLDEKLAWEGAGDLKEPIQVEGVYQIGRGSELAWFAALVNGTLPDERARVLDADAVLTANIDLGNEQWTPIAILNYRDYYSGEFNGAGYEIAGLYVNNPVSGGQGLFGGVREATISNLTVKGSVTGSTRCGGIVGYGNGANTFIGCCSEVTVNGSDRAGGIIGETGSGSEMTNCVNRGAVTASGDLAAGLVAYTMDRDIKITGCANLGPVTALRAVGGLVGMDNGNVLMENCYNTGTVTETAGTIGAASYAGGLIGLMFNSSSSIKNCYSAGEVVGVPGSANTHGAVGDYRQGGIDGGSCFIVDSVAADDRVTTVSAAELRAVPVALGAAFREDTDLNGGYPILTWQDSREVYSAAITVSPASAEVTVANAAGTTFTGTRVVDDGNVTYTFRLPEGTYTYTASAFGWTDSEGSLTIVDADVTESVTLSALDFRTVTFTVLPEAAAANAEVTLKLGDRTVEPEGSSYRLPLGEYTYTVDSPGYEPATGTLQVSAGSAALVRFSVTLTAISPWDGSTLEAPRGDGTAASPYLIANGKQLAWFAALVNGTLTDGTAQNAGAWATLTADIDLNNRSWAPIGRSSSNPYRGSFDGAGHTVSGLNVRSSSSFLGLFGAAVGASTEYSFIRNLTVEGAVTGRASYLAGVVGYTNYVDVFNCNNYATVRDEKTIGDESENIGGVVGYAPNTSLYECSNHGTIYAPNGIRVGGVAGMRVGGGTWKCFNAGNVTGGENVGGIVGYASTWVSHIYNVGNVSGKTSVGGLIGYKSCSSDYGYTTGTVTGTTFANTVFGYSADNRIGNLYYLDTLQADANATPLPEAELKALAPTLGELWKADGTGENAINNGYPVLAWQEVTYDALPQLERPWADWEQASARWVNPYAVWSEIEGAQSYIITLYDWMGSKVGEVTDITTSDPSYTADNGRFRYSLVDQMRAAGEEADINDSYSFKVQAIGDDVTYRSSELSMGSGFYNFYVKPIDAPTGPYWEGGTSHAAWEPVDLAGTYTVYVYRDGNQVASATANEVGLNLASYTTEPGDYTFTVVANPTRDAGSFASAPSEHSSVLTIEAGTAPPEEEDTVTITTAQELLALGTVVYNSQESAWAKNYKLGNDIDMSTLTAAELAQVMQIGTFSHMFKGTFDGAGHKITGLTMDNGEAGLFGYIAPAGKVMNLTIEGASLHCTSITDAAGIIAGNNYGEITGCAVINSNITANGVTNIGGMVGQNDGKISQSFVQGGMLDANNVSNAGGFVGTNHVDITECYSTADVKCSLYTAGGFVGKSGSNSTCVDCFATGDVSATLGWSGGFVGSIVSSGVSYTNCYAFNTVSSTEEPSRVHGFVGCMGNEMMVDFFPESHTLNVPSLAADAFATCYYSSDLMAGDNARTNATAKTTAEMTSDAMVTLLGSKWTRNAELNSGLPYLSAVTPPASPTTSQITVEIALATYDRDTYSFNKYGDVISVTLDAADNTRAVDVLDAAVEQGKLTYSHLSNEALSREIRTINGYTVAWPDKWLLTINDVPSTTSASPTIIKDGDSLLWYVCTSINKGHYPTFAAIADPTSVVWEDIDEAAELQALAASNDPEVLAKNYRLTADIALYGLEIGAIGSVAAPFTGVFDGQGHTISYLMLDGSDNVGLFGMTEGAVIKNLNMTNAMVTGSTNVGILLGNAGVLFDSELAMSRPTLVGNCHVSGEMGGNQNAGGLVGLNDTRYDLTTREQIYSVIDRSSAEVSVLGTGSSPNQIGGLIGLNNGDVLMSSASGDVEAEDGMRIGGLIGMNEGTVDDSYATGNVIGDGLVGGLIGSTGVYSYIESSYSLGSVAGDDDLIGSLIGSTSGWVVDCIGAGIVSTGSGSHNGGLTGMISGETRLEDVYGNTYQPEGSPLNGIGNIGDYAGSDSEVLEQLEAIGLPTLGEVSDKLYDMFGVNLKLGSDLEPELAKYADLVVVPYDTAVATELDLLELDQTPAEDVTLRVSQSDPQGYLSTEGGTAVTTAKQNDQLSAVRETVRVRLTSDSGMIIQKNITVLLLAAPDAYSSVVDNIAANLTDTKDPWSAFDMAAYSELSGKTLALTDAAKQNILNLEIATASGTNVNLSDRARVEIVLRALGIDTTRLYPANSNTPFSNAALLAAANLTAESYYPLAWILLAEQQGQFALTDTQRGQIYDLLEANIADGLFGYEWGGVKYVDAGTSAVLLAALAPVYDTDARAQALVDEILPALRLAQDATGSLGSPNTDAMVIIGLVGMGIDPHEFTNGAASVVDGLMQYLNAENDGFLYYDMANTLATEQGFRALVALSKYAELNESAAAPVAYNIYDNSAKAVVPGRATGSGETVVPSNPPSSNSDISVTFTLKGEKNDYWINETTLTLKEGSTVYHAFVQALDAAGITYVGAEKGYVSSITNGNKTLSEFGMGENSGWLYKVNDIVYQIGMLSYLLADGDDIVWYYTEDWVADPDAGGAGGLGGGGSTATPSAVLTPAATISGDTATARPTDKEVQDALSALPTGGTLVVRPTGTENADNFKLELSSSATSAITKGGVDLKLNLPDAAVTLDAAALKDISGALQIEINRLDDGSYEIKVLAGGKVLDTVTGGIKVELNAANGQVPVLVGTDGTETIITKSVVERGVVYLLLDGSGTVKLINNAKSFTDVNSGAWYAGAVDFATSHELFNGMGDNVFAPSQAMSRAMLVTVLHRLEGEPAASSAVSFIDVPTGTWYTDAVAWAAAEGIVTGVSAERFDPNAEITREQLGAILYRYANVIGMDTSARGSLDSFTDRGAISDYATEALRWAVGSGVLTGKGEGQLDPSGSATRAEVATMLQRLVSLMVK